MRTQSALRRGDDAHGAAGETSANSTDRNHTDTAGIVSPPLARRKAAKKTIMNGVNTVVLAHLFFIYFTLSSVLYLVLQPPNILTRSLSLRPARAPYRPLTFAPTTVVIGRDPLAPRNSLWRFNSRALILTSTLCVQPATKHAPVPALHFAHLPIDPRCHQVHADFTSASPVLSSSRCKALTRARVLCPHGRTHRFTGPRCPEVRPLAELDAAGRAEPPVLPFPWRSARTNRPRWLHADDVAVIVPDLSFPHNIFHFSFQIAQIADTIAALPALLRATAGTEWIDGNSTRSAGAGDAARPRRVQVVFQGAHPTLLGRWQLEILRAQLNGVARQHNSDDGSVKGNGYGSGLRVRLTALNGTLERTVRRESARPFCARRGVLLGGRGDLYLWPFANDSSVIRPAATDGVFELPRVASRAVSFRRHAYDAFGVPSSLPTVASGGGERYRLELPPAVIGYARRATFADVSVGTFRRKQWRRLTSEDEEWLLATLRTEAKRHNMSVQVVETSAKMAVRAQVQAFAGVGFVVGIHGANLVNSLFVRPFGALLELFPGDAVSPCYYAGMNGGLAYAMHEAGRVSAFESHCPKNSYCWQLKQHRRVRIDSRILRDGVRRKVAAGVKYLADLRRRFPRGVPVRYVREEGVYVVDAGGERRR